MYSSNLAQIKQDKQVSHPESNDANGSAVANSSNVYHAPFKILICYMDIFFYKKRRNNQLRCVSVGYSVKVFKKDG